MAPAEALELIRELAGLGMISLTEHARDEARQAGLLTTDVTNGLKRARACALQANGRWKVACKDFDGDDFDAVVLIRADLLVITVF